MLKLLKTTVSAREVLFDLLYDLKWVALVTIFATVTLWLPAQIIELYRTMFADRNLGDIAVLYVSVVLISAAAWISATSVVVRRLTGRPSHRPAQKGSGRVLASVLASLPFLGCGAGLRQARLESLPEALSIQLSAVGSPWENTAAELSDALGKLPFAAWAFLAHAALTAGIAFLFYPALREMIRRSSAKPSRLWLLLIVASVLCVFTQLWSPVGVPRAIGVFGSIAVFFAVLFTWAAELSVWAIRLRLPIISALLCLALVGSYFNLTDNHAVRLLPANRADVQPPRASEQFIRWYQSRPDLAAFKEEYPVYIVAASGGGIYAAFQTALFLARMQDVCPRFREHLFAISSVSGGSVGAATFSAALDNSWKEDAEAASETGADPGQESESAGVKPCPGIASRGRIPSAAAFPGKYEKRVTDVLLRDHLSPLVAATLFSDFLQRFIPFPIPAFDRARSLEFSFESALKDASKTEAGLFERSFMTSWAPEASSPALIVNATDVGSGRRFLISPFVLDAVPQYGASGQGSALYFPFWRNPPEPAAEPTSQGERPNTAVDLRLSTAMGISARFPWVTPAASLPAWISSDGTPRTIRLVDGGYVDNSGVETALDLIDSLKETQAALADQAKADTTLPPRNNIPVRPVRIILIVLTGGSYPERTFSGLGETMEPVRALLTTRETRAYVAIDRATRQMPVRDFERMPVDEHSKLKLSDVRRVGLANQYYDLPLGWEVSSRTRDIIAQQSGRGTGIASLMTVSSRASRRFPTLTAFKC
jgi:hypothetical protein